MTVRLVDAIRAGLGIRSLTVDPSSELGRPGSAAEAGVLRFLGVRQVVQAVLVARTDLRALSAAVDALHGLSMVVLLLAAPRRYGRVALRQAVTAVALVLLEVRTQRD